MIFILYLIITLAFTYPLILHIGTHMQGAGDGFYFLWELWWFSHSVWTGKNPLHNDTLFYPAQDVRMAWWTAVNEIPAVLLEPVAGPVVTYNLLILFNIALSGYTAFLLVRTMTGNSLAGFVSGFIYTFAPFHMINAFKGLLNMTTWQWMPLCALAGLKLIGTPSLRRTLFFGFTLSLVSLSDGYLCAYFFVLFIPAWIIVAWVGLFPSSPPAFGGYTGEGRVRRKSLFLYVLASFCIFGALSSPFLLSYVSLARISTQAALAGYDVGIYSQRLLRYIIPYKFHPLWGTYFSWFYPDPYIEASCFTGYLPLVLGVLGLRQKGGRGAKLLWGAIGLAAVVFSLGPYLHVRGLVSIGPYPVPMPYLILSYVPFFSYLRLPARFSVIAILSLSVLSGFALSTLGRVRGRDYFVLCILILGISLEYVLLVPYPLTDATIPPLYHQVKGDPTVRAILELPSGQLDPDYIWNMNKYMYYQTLHHKPMVSGHVPRDPDGVEDFTLETPFLQELTHPKVLIKGDIVPLDMKRIALDGVHTLKRNRIDMIILHKNAQDALPAVELKALSRLLTSTLGRTFYEDQDLMAFRVSQLEGRGILSPPFKGGVGGGFQPSYTLGKGWYEPHFKGASAHRHAGERAEIYVDAHPGRYRLRFGFLRPHVHTKTLELYNDDKMIDVFDVSRLTIGQERTFISRAFIFQGKSRLLFRAREGAVSPMEMISRRTAVEHPAVFPVALDIFHVKLVPQ